MSLGVQNNLSAVKANNKAKISLSGIKKSAEKLSSGLQINRSADNASGLAVSEKMRSQIRGLSQAANNVNDGISLIQTAEGGLNETHAALQRMRELSVQASNGTYQESDREAIQLELNALQSEIDRIAKSTEYNGIPLLDGETVLGIKSDKMQNEYGALYGSVNYNLAIGGGKIVVTSQIRDMYLKFTTDASGKGGENAVYGYDFVKTQGDLTQHITINLAKGQTYTDKQIQDLINNASVPKNFEAPTGKITFKSEYGFINAGNAQTYGLVTGTTHQTYSIPTTDFRQETKAEKFRISTRYPTKRCSITWEDTPAANPKPIAASPNGSVRLSKNCQYTAEEIKQALLNSGSTIFNSNEKDHQGNVLNPDGMTVRYGSPSPLASPTASLYFYCSEKYEKAYTEHYPSINFTLRASQYGSYEEYKEDEIKYRQPDCIGDFNRKAIKSVSVEVSDSIDRDVECSVNDDVLQVKLKAGSTVTSSTGYSVQSFLRGKGYNYYVDVDYVFDEGAKDDADNDKVYSFTAKAGASVNGKLTVKGSRFVKKVGTVAGERAVFEAELDDFAGQDGNPILHSSDHIAFTANSYSSGTHCQSLVNDFSVVIDAEEGKESASVEYIDKNPDDTYTQPVKTAVIHLATGTRYSEAAIENLLKDAGLNYSVSLTDKAAPDAVDDHYVYFVNGGEASVRQTGSGKGVGIEDVADLTDRLVFQAGANGTEDQQISMKLENSNCGKLGVDDIDISNVDKANKSIEKIDNAIKTVSMQRAGLGTLQNRMEYTMNNITNAGERLTDAESVIRDTDMAEEMVKYTKDNMMQQVAQTVFAQTNQMTSGILQLLQ